MPTETHTPLSPTETEDIVAALIPVGIPASDWNGIPIMPGGLAGEGDALGYTFTIQAGAEEIQQYYETALYRDGFELFATGENDDKETVMLFFMKGSESIVISLIPNDDLILVV